MQVNEQRAKSTLGKVTGGHLDKLTIEELEEALLFFKNGFNLRAYDTRAAEVIEVELAKRNRHENIKISNKILTWQKITVIISIISIFIIAIITYFKS